MTTNTTIVTALHTMIGTAPYNTRVSTFMYNIILEIGLYISTYIEERERREGDSQVAAEDPLLSAHDLPIVPLLNYKETNLVRSELNENLYRPLRVTTCL